MYAELLSQLRDRLAALTEAEQSDSSEELKKSIATVVKQLDDAIKHINEEIACQASVARELQRTTSTPLHTKTDLDPNTIRCESYE